MSAVKAGRILLKPPAGPSSVLVKAAAAPAAPAAAEPAAGFKELGVSSELLAALQEKAILQPTEIQSAAVPAILRDRRSDFLLASHTGSGKTLAYLLPIVHILKQAETSGVATKPRRPRALVLGPTRELTDQILLVAKQLSHQAKFRSACVNGGGDWGKQREQLERAIDVVVGTPSKVVQHAEKGSMYYGDVEVVVIDEADTMFDRGFGPEVKAILKAVRGKEQPARCIMVSATMSKAVRRLIEEEFPRMRTLETQTLHRGVAGARHAFLPLPPGSADKLEVLVQVVEGEQRRGRRLMVFCNTLDSCRAAEHHLRERGIATVCYHGDVPLDGRRAAIAAFSAADDSEEAEGRGCPILVATDLAARGLDIPGRVDHVVNFDFPLNPIDYLHRTGRTARAGATGRITSLVGKGDRVLAQRVEEALQRGLPLDQLSANKHVVPPHMRPKPETLQRQSVERKAAKHAARGTRGSKRVELVAGKGGRGSGSRIGSSIGGGGNSSRSGSSTVGGGSSSSRGSTWAKPGQPQRQQQGAPARDKRKAFSKFK
ncbi:hypothetical protein N2152v2_006586 [Parachlorella kessleri]